MNSNSQETLRWIEQNDAQFIEFLIGNYGMYDGFTSSDASDYSRLGAALGNNTHLIKLTVALHGEEEDPLDIANTEFFDGLKRNSSISNLVFSCNGHNIVGVGHEILKSYQDNNNNLTRLYPRCGPR